MIPTQYIYATNKIKIIIQSFVFNRNKILHFSLPYNVILLFVFAFLYSIAIQQQQQQKLEKKKKMAKGKKRFFFPFIFLLENIFF